MQTLATSPEKGLRRQAGTFVLVPAGEFEMGGVPFDKYVSAVELPRRRLKIPAAFSIGVAPVTEMEWSSFDPGFFTQKAPSSKPMVNVNLSQITAFLQWLSRGTHGRRYRLPTEEEWEYACRSGGNSIFPWGNDITADNANYRYDERGGSVGPGKRTTAGRYPANDFGLFDMNGNVCEWTSSPWRAHSGTGIVDHTRHVIRGGSWDQLPRSLRSSWRDWAPVEARYDNLGFRLIEERNHE